MQLDLFSELPQVLTVTQLTRQVKELLEGEFVNLTVEGEISGWKVSPSGHAYFSLKDENAVINCVMWRSSLGRLGYDPEHGVKVLATGSFSVYPPRGTYQLVTTRLEPVGVGALQLRFEALKKQLAAEGLFDESRKRPVPLLPQRIGVVTSPTGAAVRDFLKIIKQRFPSVEIQIFPARVQGKEAPSEIAAGVETLNRMGEVDVIIVTRGGGSLEDLWAFNEEIVVRAIAASKVPVISAVGHEVDYTISDFVADLRVPTPTAAALYVVEAREELASRIQNLRANLSRGVRYLLNGQRSRLADLERALERNTPLQRINFMRQRLDDLMLTLSSRTDSGLKDYHRHLAMAEVKLGHNLDQSMGRYRERLTLLNRRLEAISPRRVLARGFALCEHGESGEILTSPGQVKPGDPLKITLRDGVLKGKAE